MVSIKQGLSMAMRNAESTVLVVNDVPDLLEMMSLLLRNSGYNVITAFDGREGFELARAASPDLVVSDVAMPRVDGIELCRLIREHGGLRATPVLLVSAERKDSESVIKGLKAGADDYMEAPYDPMRLIAKVAQLVERKRAGEMLFRLASIVESSDDAIIGKTLDGIITSWNKGAERSYGYSADEVIGQPISIIIPPELDDELPRIMGQLKCGALVHHYETVRVRKDGNRIHVSLTVSPVKDAAGKVVGASAIGRDITERKRAEDQIRRLNEALEHRVAERTAQLQASNKELEAFSYSVSHDLRAPLRHINGFSQALLEDYADKLDEEGKSYLQEVRSATQEMAQLIDDVLQLARVTRSEMRREVVNLSEMARAVVAELRKGDEGRSVAVNIEEGLSSNGDKRLLRVMLGNLLGNAWKFTSKRERAEIAFGHEKRDAESVYFVRDNGAGFDMAYVNKLFGAFQRLHTAREFEGTGIGLATVQRIINRHGGRVWAEGAINQGATFYFTLPDFKETSFGEQSDIAGRR
jgi:PAS domain S-box-containing protein